MKTKNIFFTIALAMFTTIAFAQLAGTAHDFSGAAWNSANGDGAEICNACHTPHNGFATTAAPLWSRTETIGTFTAYATATFNADDLTTASDGVAAAYTTIPTGVSLLCLTCHDGVQKLDYTGTVATTMTIQNSLAVRNGGSDEHPISIDYSTQLIAADGGLQPIVTATPRLSSTGTVECSSCHDVHNANNINGGVGLMAASNTGSALCIACHAK